MSADIKNIIFEEKSLLKELLKLLDEQYDYLLGSDPLKVDKVARDLEDISKKVARCEIDRRKIMGAESDVSKIVEDINDKALSSAYKEVQTVLLDIEIQKKANEELLKNKVFYTKKMLNILNPQRQKQTYNAYGQMRK